MSVAITFDSLGFFNKLKNAGVPENQAEAITDAMREQTESNAREMRSAIKEYDKASREQLATKGDLEDVRNELKLEIQEVRNELKLEIQEVRTEIQKSENHLKTWLIGAMIAQTTLIFTILGLMNGWFARVGG